MAALSADSDDFFDLLARLRRGDEDAWRRVVFEQQAIIFGVASRLVGAEDAKEVTQEVFKKAFAKIAQFKGEATFSTWLYRIALNECHLVLRKRRKKRLANPPPHPSQDGGQANHELLEQWELVRTVIDQLDEESRLVLTLKFFKGLSYRQIAKELGWSSPATVHKKVWKAIERVRKLLSQSGGGGC